MCPYLTLSYQDEVNRPIISVFLVDDPLGDIQTPRILESGEEGICSITYEYYGDGRDRAGICCLRVAIFLRHPI